MHPHARALSSCLRSTLPQSSAPRGCRRSMPCPFTLFQLVSISSALRHSPCPAMPCRGAHEREREGHTRGTREREGGRGRGGAGNRLLRYGRRWSSENCRRCSCHRRRLDRRARREHSHLARAEPSQPVERLELRAHRPSAPACDERESARARGSTREAAHEKEREQEAARERGSARGFLHEVLVQALAFVLELVERRARRVEAREHGRERGRAGERKHGQRAARARRHERERGAAGGRERSLCLGFLSRRLLLFWGLLSTSVAGSLVSRLSSVKGVTCGFSWAGSIARAANTRRLRSRMMSGTEWSGLQGWCTMCRAAWQAARWARAREREGGGRGGRRRLAGSEPHRRAARRSVGPAGAAKGGGCIFEKT